MRHSGSTDSLTGMYPPTVLRNVWNDPGLTRANMSVSHSSPPAVIRPAYAGWDEYAKSGETKTAAAKSLIPNTVRPRGMWPEGGLIPQLPAGRRPVLKIDSMYCGLVPCHACSQSVGTRAVAIRSSWTRAAGRLTFQAITRSCPGSATRRKDSPTPASTRGFKCALITSSASMARISGVLASICAVLPYLFLIARSAPRASSAETTIAWP
mmetsp:Transcript_46645/g.129776  ORF Transcript_46645/g.129776 Transcript_46645/m.129776 type:complete len:210 (+) Transcript_46645:294-923(+)